MGENSNDRHILSLSTTMASQWTAAVAVVTLTATLGAFPAYCFSSSCPLSRGHRCYDPPSFPCSLQAVNDPSSPESTHSRRSWLQTSLVATTVLLPAPALAGIDVSGLQQQSGANSNSVIRDQLRAYDGSASTRLQQAKELSSTTGSGSIATTTAASASSNIPPTIASLAYRYTLNNARSQKEGVLWTRYQDLLQGSNPKQSIPVEFKYPSDWLQLGRALGGLQFVDQRNGDKLYVLRVQLPAGETLETVNKNFLGTAIFDPQGSFVTTGNDVADYKVTSSKVLVASSATGGASTRRRLKLKYTTVTGNNYSIERRGLLDCYEVKDTVYMLLTSSNAVKFEAGGRERDTVEAMVDSFRVGV